MISYLRLYILIYFHFFHRSRDTSLVAVEDEEADNKTKQVMFSLHCQSSCASNVSPLDLAYFLHFNS